MHVSFISFSASVMFESSGITLISADNDVFAMAIRKNTCLSSDVTYSHKKELWRALSLKGGGQLLPRFPSVNVYGEHRRKCLLLCYLMAITLT